MRKTIGKAMAATTSLALALSMAACGSSSENAEEATKVGGTITIWTWEQPGKAFEAAAKGFQEANPGTTVKVENSVTPPSGTRSPQGSLLAARVCPTS